MKAIKLNPWNPSEHLKTEEDIALYLKACMDEGDPALIEHAQGIAARARQAMQAGKRERQADEN